MHAPLPVRPLPVADWDTSLAGVLDDMKGRPLNVHALMAHHPQLLNAWWNFRNHAVGGGTLGKRRGELVILRVAQHLRSWYEWGSHVERAQACGITPEEIERVKEGPQAAGWTVAESLLLQAVDELVAGQAITTRTLAALNEHFDTRQLLDLIAIQGMYMLLGCMINTWGLELDEQVRKELPAGVTRETFSAGFLRN